MVVYQKFQTCSYVAIRTYVRMYVCIRMYHFTCPSHMKCSYVYSYVYVCNDFIHINTITVNHLH